MAARYLKFARFKRKMSKNRQKISVQFDQECHARQEDRRPCRNMARWLKQSALWLGEAAIQPLLPKLRYCFGLGLFFLSSLSGFLPLFAASGWEEAIL